MRHLMWFAVLTGVLLLPSGGAGAHPGVAAHAAAADVVVYKREDPPVVKPSSRDEWTVTPASGLANWKHCCDAGSWEVNYHYNLPPDLTLGRDDKINLSID